MIKFLLSITIFWGSISSFNVYYWQLLALAVYLNRWNWLAWIQRVWFDTGVKLIQPSEIGKK